MIRTLTAVALLFVLIGGTVPVAASAQQITDAEIEKTIRDGTTN